MTDVFLKAGILSTRAMCIRVERQSATQQVDFEAIDKAIHEIEKRAGNLEDVRKSAETIQSASTKILDRVRIDREALEKQVGVLRERVADLKTTVSAPQ
jgi:septal ring factor EnvC (AmiA/AmiB activator)